VSLESGIEAIFAEGDAFEISPLGLGLEIDGIYLYLIYVYR